MDIPVFEKLCSKVCEKAGIKTFRPESRLMDRKDPGDPLKLTSGEAKMALAIRLLARGSYLDLVPLFDVATSHLYVIFNAFLDWILATLEFLLVDWSRNKNWNALESLANSLNEINRGDTVRVVQCTFPNKNPPWFGKSFGHLRASDQTSVKPCEANQVVDGSDDCYSDFVPFTVKEVQQHLGLLIMNGLSPSPNMDLKFDRADEANYNHFVDVSMPNGLRRHRHFRAFFAVQDPRKQVPTRRTSPMFKLLPLINWINKVGQVSWELSLHLAVDEQTIGFQGRHYAKLRIAYKAEGDGFQCDALCDRGFTHSVYFRNELPPKKCTKMGLSPLHARVMWLFDRIEEEYSRVWMDNLYISAKFAKFAYKHPKKVMIAGAARKNGRGIPGSVVQEEKKKVPEMTWVRNTVKAAVLQGDKDVPNLVAVSVYDTKPVHFISMICECIEWVLKTKQVWNEQQQKMDKVKFLRLNMNDDYNRDMNAVDISDQLRNNYRFDHWLRNFKWWWAIMLWGIGTLLVNSYVSYTSACDMFGLPKRERFTHCQFRLAVARVWIDPNGIDIVRRWKAARAARGVPSNNDQAPTNIATNEQLSGGKRARSRSRSRSPIRSPHPSTPSISSLSASGVGSVETYGSSGKSVGSSDSKKSPRLDDNTLSPCGKLKGRLDHFGGRRHLPISRESAGKSKEARCALHRWALGRDCIIRTGVMVCQDCNVPLCVDCYAVFHTEEDLVSKKAQLRSMMEGDKAAKKEANKEAAAKKQPPKTATPMAPSKKKAAARSPKTPGTPKPAKTPKRVSKRNNKQRK